MAGHYHLIRSQDANVYTAWCGHEQRSRFRMVDNHEELRNVCPKCSARYHANQLKTNPIDYRLGDRLDLTADRRSEFKSVYPILDRKDECVGYVTIGHGWNKQWCVHALTGVTSPSGATIAVIGDAISYGTSSFQVRASTWASKEAALAAVPMLITDGMLKSADSVIAVYNTMREQQRAQHAAQRVKRDAEIEKLARIQAGFREILAMEITNFQREALMDAAAKLRIDI